MFKPYRSLLLLGCGLFAFSACNKDDFSDAKSSSNSDHAAAVRAQIVKLGCPADKIEDHGDFFLADGDIAIPKNMDLADINTSINHAHEEQAYSVLPNSLINGGFKQRNIKLFVGSEMKAYVGEVGAAMHKWNQDAENNISFSIVSSGSDVHIDGDDFPGNAPLQYAQIPTRGEPGAGGITVNKRVFSRLNSAQRIAVLTHALGHTIGFVHTDWRTEGRAGKDMPHIPSSDASSIMNSAIHSGAGYVFNPSIYDYAALRTLYPSRPRYLTLTLVNRNTIKVKWLGPMHAVRKYQMQYRMTQNGRPTQGVLDINDQDWDGETTVFLPAGGSLKFEAQIRAVYLDNYITPYSELKSIIRGPDPL